MTTRKAARLALAAAAIAAAALAQTFSGGGGGGDTRASFILCNGQPCTVGSDLTNPWIATKKAKVKKCFAKAKTAPIGAPLTFDLRIDGVSIFGGNPKLIIPAGSTAVVSVSTFAAPQLQEGSTLRIDQVTIGTTYPGKDVSVVCSIQ